MGILETQIENRFVDTVEQEGCIAVKLNLKGRKGWPDRLIVLENGQCFFIEFKAPGKTPEKLQIHIHSKLQQRGHRIYVCDGYEEAMYAYQIEKVRTSKISKAINKVLNRKK